MRTSVPRPTAVLLLLLRRRSHLRCRCFSLSASPRLPSPSFPRGGGGQWHHRAGEDESRAVPVRVWWDLENCQVPKGVDPHRISHRIAAALRSHAIRGPLSISAFGDILQLPNRTRDALCTTGVCLYHVPNRGMNSADRSILADLVSWVTQNPPPAHFFLISGDRDFADILHRLRMSNYNILIASSDGASGALCSAATIMWHWNGLVRGDELVGKHFNYPPDGQHSSWYGHYKGALENPFHGSEEDAGLQVSATEESRIRPIPLAFLSKISNILSSNPKGIAIDDLLREIKRSNVVLDKDYFGHKKFSNLISSLPHIAKMKPHPTLEGRNIVFSTHGVPNETDTSNLRHNQGEKSRKNDEQLKNGDLVKKLPSAEICEKPSTGDCSEVPTRFVDESTHIKDGNPPHLASMPSASMVESSSKDINETTLKSNIIETVRGKDISVNDNLPFPMEENAALPKGGLFKRFWPTWLWGGSTVGKNENSNISSSGSLSSNHEGNSKNAVTRISANTETCVSGNVGIRKQHSNFSESLNGRLSSSKPRSSKCKDFHSGDHDSCSTVPHHSSESSAAEPAKVHGTIITSTSGFFRRIRTWCTFWKAGSEGSEGEPVDIGDGGLTSPVPSKAYMELPRKYDNTEIKPKPHLLFSNPQFWQSLENFLHTRQGSELVLNSTSRTHLGQGLLKEASSILVSLEEHHVLYLVDLLVSEKKWIHECISQANPFKFLPPHKRSHAQTDGGLSFIFPGKIPQTDHRIGNMQDVSGNNCQTAAGFMDGKVKIKVPKDLEELKAWYHRIVDMGQIRKAEDLNINFQKDFGKTLDSLHYGYSTLDDLLASFSAGNSNQTRGKKGSLLSREEIISDCKSLISEVLEKNPDGFLLASFKPMFLERYGYPFDCRKLGHSKLVHILKTIPGVKVDSEMILPFRAPGADFSMDKQVNNQLLASYVGVNHCKHTEDEDFSWDELGPPKECGVNEYDGSNKAEKKMHFEEVSISDEDSSDSECSSAAGTNLHEVLRSRRKAEETSLLQILESWHSGKESKRTLAQSVNDPADCFGKFCKKHGESMPSVSPSSNARLKKNYNFVLIDEDAKNEVGNKLNSI